MKDGTDISAKQNKAACSPHGGAYRLILFFGPSQSIDRAKVSVGFVRFFMLILWNDFEDLIF